MESVMKKRREEAAKAYEAQWADGKGSHHPDFDPRAFGDDVVKASRVTEELYNAIVKNDVRAVYKKIEEGADVNFLFARQYKSEEGYTPLMTAAHRGRLEIARALLRAGADPNMENKGGDLTIFWAIDGGAEMIKLFTQHGVDLDKRSPKDWTALSYARAKGKYGAVEDKGIYPEDVLLYYGAKAYGSGPEAMGARSPRNSYDPSAVDFLRERGSYQNPFARPG